MRQSLERKKIAFLMHFFIINIEIDTNVGRIFAPTGYKPNLAIHRLLLDEFHYSKTFYP